MGIFRRAPRGRHASAESAPATPLGAEGAASADTSAEVAASLGTGAVDVSAVTPNSGAGSAQPGPTQPAPAPHRPTNFSPEAVAASIASDAERFVATFPYAASPVPEGALDFTRASLTHIEAMLGALHVAGRPLPERLHQSIAVYLFETARREFGGRYLRFEAPDPLILLVGEPRAEVGICAMSRIASRVQQGPEESIVHYYASIAPLIAEGAIITLR